MEVEFILTGTKPLLFHADDVESADELDAWRKAPDNKNRSKAGDDRSPPWTWTTYLYNDGVHICWPFANVAKGLTTAATRVPLKGNKTFKELAAGAISINEVHLEFRRGPTRKEEDSGLKIGPQIPWALIRDLRANDDALFSEHKEFAHGLGFDLSIKRAKIGQAKHVRVRAEFDAGWTVRGSLAVHSTEITFEHLKMFFEIAGKGGQGDWRPWSPKSPGPYGQFTSEIKLKKVAKVA